MDRIKEYIKNVDTGELINTGCKVVVGTSAFLYALGYFIRALKK